MIAAGQVGLCAIWQRGIRGQQIALTTPNGRNAPNWFKTFFGEEEEEDRVWVKFIFKIQTKEVQQRGKRDLMKCLNRLPIWPHSVKYRGAIFLTHVS